MLQITVPTVELYNEETEEFITRKGATLRLEHSLVSLRKWESKWCKPFLSSSGKTDEELLDYVKCMTITQNVDPEVYLNLTHDNIAEINRYIDSPMTATTFSEDKTAKKKREVVTAELIYYWMIALGIPPEYQTWHLNQLLTLIRVCNIKNQPSKKRSRKEIASSNAALNAARRKQLNTNG
jgi:hypothetical protein